jgi:hypothetical protein
VSRVVAQLLAVLVTAAIGQSTTRLARAADPAQPEGESTFAAPDFEALWLSLSLGVRLTGPPSQPYWDTLETYSFGSDGNSELVAFFGATLGASYALGRFVGVGGSVSYLGTQKTADPRALLDMDVTVHVLEVTPHVRVGYQSDIAAIGVELAGGVEVPFVILDGQTEAHAQGIFRPALFVHLGEDFGPEIVFGYALPVVTEGDRGFDRPSAGGFMLQAGIYGNVLKLGSAP